MNLVSIMHWATSNSKIECFKNGDSIYETKSAEEWATCSKLGEPAFMRNDKNGHWYNAYVIADNRGFAPDGWKIPDKDDWGQLFDAIERKQNSNLPFVVAKCLGAARGDLDIGFGPKWNGSINDHDSISPGVLSFDNEAMIIWTSLKSYDKNWKAFVMNKKSKEMDFVSLKMGKGALIRLKMC